MTNQIVYIDRSKLRPGKLDELKSAISELVEFIEAREPQLISYAFYLDEQASRMTVVAVHPDADSVELHMEVGGAGLSWLRRVHRDGGHRGLRRTHRPGARATAAEG